MFENRDDYFANYIEEDKAGKAQFLWVSLFYFMAKACMDEYGTEGEKVIRQAVRDLGKERAVRKRQRSDEMGMEPNLVSMTKVIDLYGEPRFSFGKQISEATPEEKIIKVYTCPNCNIWARLEGKKSGDYLKIGSIYCEEVHHYLYGKYDPAIQVNLCEILTKGDPLCNFRLNMREANKSAYAVPVYEPQSWEDYGTDVTGSIYTVFCLNYFHYGKAIYDTLGKNTLRNGLKAFGKCRGERIRELNRRKGQENTIENLLEQGDLLLDDREKPEIEKVSDAEYRIHFRRNIMKEVLTSHRAEELLDIYHGEAFAALAAAYNSRMKTEITELPQKTGYEMKIRVEE